ncbi:MAG: hypothetical protein OSB47_11930 [Pirellulaceae bacterium]|jgi:sulfopyruvate decarboxylase subunit alpha|nr:hypothetical protein [Pirellulaceae bacterium]
MILLPQSNTYNTGFQNNRIFTFAYTLARTMDEHHLYQADEFVQLLEELEITHVVWVPDSTLGLWESALLQSNAIQLVSVCREGEAWAVAAGLHLGGARPLVIIQCTGLFESGDALRNVLHDYQLPLYALVGYRSYLNSSSLPGDTCLAFTEPILEAWNVESRFIDSHDKKHLFKEHYLQCQQDQKPGVTLLAEGRA